jgi:hypothetical protein
MKPGQALQSLRPKVSGKCRHCGAEFTGYPSKQYCSRNCKRMAKYYRQKAERS